MSKLLGGDGEGGFPSAVVHTVSPLKDLTWTFVLLVATDIGLDDRHKSKGNANTQVKDYRALTTLLLSCTFLCFSIKEECLHKL